MSLSLLGISPRLTLPDDADYRADYGVLNEDLMPRVHDCLDRASLLNFVLVNKTWRFIGRGSLKYLYFRSEAQRLLSEGAPDTIVALNFFEMLSAVRDKQSAMSDRQKADLLICWIENIIDEHGDAENRGIQPAMSGRKRAMLATILAASDCVQMPERAGVLWEVLTRSISFNRRPNLEMLEELKQRSDCLPEAQKGTFELAYLDASGEGASFNKVLEAQGLWPAACQDRLLMVICFGLNSLPAKMRPDGDAVAKCIARVSSFPLVNRLLTLIFICAYCEEAGLKLQMPPQQWLDLEAMLAECNELSDHEKITAISKLVIAIALCEKNSLLDADMAASLHAMKHAVRDGLLDIWLALPPDLAQDQDTLARILKRFFNVDCSNEEERLKALELICAANRRLWGTTHGDRMPPGLFQLFNGARGTKEIGAVLKRAEFISSGADKVTWRSMICFPPASSAPRGELDISHSKCLLSLRNAAGLPEPLRLQITSNVLAYGISVFTPRYASKLIDIALSAAAGSPAAHAGILRIVAALVGKMNASYRQSVVMRLIASADALAESDKVAVLLAFLQAAFPLIDDSKELQSAFDLAAEKLGSTSPQAKLHALMALANIDISKNRSGEAWIYLLDTLLQQCAGLESAQQAALLFCMAFRVRLLPAKQAQDMLSKLIGRAGQLDLSEQSRAAWTLLYRLTADKSLAPGSASWQAAVEQQCASLSEAQREAVRAAVETIMQATENLRIPNPLKAELEMQNSEELSEDSLVTSEESDADTEQSSSSGSSVSEDEEAEDASSAMPHDAASGDPG